MSSGTSPLVSIITPVYNGAEYLAECIESVLAQTYENWDYTIVNNCSTDGSAEIARRYAARDLRIKVFDNQRFLRAVPNHNVALRQISPHSKYCKVIFADDWMFPQCLERMVGVAEENPSVGIVGAYALQGRKVMWDGLCYPSTVISGRDVCRKLYLEDIYVFGTSSSLLYRSDLVRSHDPFYNESNLHADVEVCCALLKTCDFGFVHQVLAFTRERPGSLTEFTTSMNTLLPGKLYDLVTNGPDYLSPKEFAQCLDRKLSEYYVFLARVSVEGRDEKFWDYHRRKLREMGVGFDRLRLAATVLRGVIRHPKGTIEALLRNRIARLADKTSSLLKMAT